MSYGFVYVLKNDAMNVFKAGCTERSPHARAEELSSGTAVPAPFAVVCYAEFDEFQLIEKQLHAFLSDYRISSNREFFWDDCINKAIAYLFFHPASLAFSDVAVFEVIDGPYHAAHELPNPWKKEEEKAHVESNVVPIDGASAA